MRSLPLAILLAACAATVGAAPVHAGDKPLNILVVLSDDHSVPHVGCYGNPDIRTPNLDRFAKQGLRCDRAYVMCPQCVPSRASIMTGRSPVAIGMTRFSAPLPREVKVVPELLKERGYFAGVAGRTYHLDGSKLPDESKSVFDRHRLQTFTSRLDFVKTAGTGPLTLSQYREFLDAVPKGKPFVLQLCFSDPHRPLDKDAIPRPHDPKKIKLPAHFPDTQLVREDFARYYDEISRFDGYFAEVLAELEKRGLADSTLIIFMGDNGCAMLRGKGTLYDLGLHIPCLVRWPGRVPAGSTTSELISGEDIAPTLLEAAGAPVPKEMTGKSFLKLLKGEKHEGRKYVFAERGAHGSGLPTNSAAFDLGRCVISKSHKLIYNALWQIPYTPVDFAGDPFWKELQQLEKDGKLSPLMSRLYFAPTRPMFELFDLKADPNEFENLYGKAEVATVERELRAALQEWMILERDYVPLPVPPPLAPKKKDGKKGKAKAAFEFPVAQIKNEPADKKDGGVEIDETRRLGLFFDWAVVKTVGLGDTMSFGLIAIDPSNPQDPNPKRLTYDHRGRTNATVVQIDGAAKVFGGGAPFGKWLVKPSVTTGKVQKGEATWVFDQEAVQVTQTVEVVPGDAAELVPGKMRRPLDRALVRYKIENKDSRAHKVGLRTLIDTLIGANDGTPFTVPGAPGLVTTFRDMRERRDVPDFIQAFEFPDLDSPGTVVQMNLKLTEKLAPDRVVLTRWPGPKAHAWEVPVENMRDDSAVVLYWNPIDMKPGESRDLAYSYGLGHLQRDKLALTVGGSRMVGGEMTVVAYVADPQPNAVAILKLPAGFEFVAGATANQPVPLGELGKDQKRQPSPVTWRIRATAAGRHTLIITSSSGLQVSQAVVIEPAQKDQP